jgi:hypothetical protein
MNNITPHEKKHLNTITAKYHLGDKLEEVINVLNDVSVGATPVNAVAAGKELAITGVVKHGETVMINNPNVMQHANIYEFVADVALSVTSIDSVPVDINALTVKSAGSLTVATQPTAGDTMTIGEKVFTFVPDGTANADGEITIGTSLATAKTAIVAAINGVDGHNDPHPLVSAVAFAANICAITALIGGVLGDAIVTTETFAAVGNLFGAGTLANGIDCTAPSAVTALVTAITLNDTQGVGAVDGDGDVVELTADTKGILGNDIIISESMANGAFDGAATTLSGGIDGTVARAFEFRIDSGFIYVAIAENSVSDAYWRKVAIGAL